MLSLCRLIRGVVHDVEFQRGGSLSLYAEDGLDRVLYLHWRDESNQIVVNDCIGDVWGSELSLPVQDKITQRVFFKFEVAALELWVEQSTLRFFRFDEQRFASVGLAKLWNAAISRNCVPQPEDNLAANTWYTPTIHDRIDKVERFLAARVGK